jgi:arginine utilization regulatory protein
MRSTERDHILPVAGGGSGGRDALAAFWGAQKSVIVRNMLGTAEHFAMSDLGVRIVGERGSGKLQLARLIHGMSSRAEFSFRHVACTNIAPESADETLFGRDGADAGTGALPGIIESSRGGTVYLDEYYALTDETRFRLRKVMELKHLRRTGGSTDVAVDIRLITGITKNPAYPAEYQNTDSEGARKISPICINIPPLRERKEDIDSLIYLFLGEFSQSSEKSVMGITPRALEYCRYYDWPGNIYELHTVIYQCAARSRGDNLDLPDLPEYLGHRYSPHQGDPVARA